MGLVFLCQNSLVLDPEADMGLSEPKWETYLFDRLLEPLESFTAVLHIFPTWWIFNPVTLLMLASLANVLDFVVGVCVLNLIKVAIFSRSVC